MPVLLQVSCLNLKFESVDYVWEDDGGAASRCQRRRRSEQGEARGHWQGLGQERAIAGGSQGRRARNFMVLSCVRVCCGRGCRFAGNLVVCRFRRRGGWGNKHDDGGRPRRGYGGKAVTERRRLHATDADDSADAVWGEKMNIQIRGGRKSSDQWIQIRRFQKKIDRPKLFFHSSYP